MLKRQMIIAFHKPYGVLSQFSANESKWSSLKEFNFPKDVYPIGRLDADSEGLLLLSDERDIIDQLLNPRKGHKRTYWVQVEGIPTEEDLDKHRKCGQINQGHSTLPCEAKLLENAPVQHERIPPIRVRKSIPDSWIELTLTEGKNRQVRRMTAAIGHPTLRLVRGSIGRLNLRSEERRVGKE